MADGFNVDRFIASLGLRGVLKTNKFQVTFTLPPCFQGDELQAYYVALSRDQGLWCDRAAIPGIFLQTLKFRRYGYGSLDTTPLVPVFNDIQLSFIADGRGDNWRMFHKWINKCVNSDSSGGMWNGNTETTSEGRQLFPYETGYQEDYEAPMIVSVYNDAGDRVKNVFLNQAFPTAISEIKLDWGDNGDVARFIVNFSIQDWFATDVTDVDPVLEGPGFQPQ